MGIEIKNVYIFIHSSQPPISFESLKTFEGIPFKSKRSETQGKEAGFERLKRFLIYPFLFPVVIFLYNFNITKLRYTLRDTRD